VLWDGKMRGLGTYAAAASRAWEADGKAAANLEARWLRRLAMGAISVALLLIH
jgi:hypothetical protein